MSEKEVPLEICSHLKMSPTESGLPALPASRLIQRATKSVSDERPWSPVVLETVMLLVGGIVAA